MRRKYFESIPAAAFQQAAVFAFRKIFICTFAMMSICCFDAKQRNELLSCPPDEVRPMRSDDLTSQAGGGSIGVGENG